MSEAAKAATTNVFVLMLENHSFDQMLGRSNLPGLRVAPADAQNSYDGAPYPVFSPAPWSMTTDPGHEFPDVLQQVYGADAAAAYLTVCDKGTTKHPNPSYDPAACERARKDLGRIAYPDITLNGFVSSYATSNSEGTGTPDAKHYGDIMGCFNTATQLPVLYQLAQQFAVCDAWHASMPGPTWPNRYFVHGGSSAGMDVSPEMDNELRWETLHGFEYENGSIFDALRDTFDPLRDKQCGFRLYQDKANDFSDHPSHWWQGGWISQVASLKGLNLTDVHSLRRFKDDIQEVRDDGPAYAAVSYTFIEPNFGASFFSKQRDPDGQSFGGPRYVGGSSQHPEDDCYGGEALIKFAYETVFGADSPIRESSLLIITYDEHGGFFDSAPPEGAVKPGDATPKGQEHLNRYSFGFDV